MNTNHIAKTFEKFLSGKVVMDISKAKTIKDLVVSIQAKYGLWASFPLEEDIDTRRALFSDYKKLDGQEVTFKKILEVAENYDIWHCEVGNNIEKIEAVIRFVESLVNLYGN